MTLGVKLGTHELTTAITRLRVTAIALAACRRSMQGYACSLILSANTQPEIAIARLATPMDAIPVNITELTWST